ncbi:DNA repair protein XRCC2 [Diabrotica undecimpunctata]|uniref:DNA repair protein XRCC2 n=1 Tax=Diabrotica undecimpunctata TaxID=50387 RepID=UPI003B6380D1
MNNSHIESGIQLFKRLNRKTFLEGINPHFFPDGGPFPNQVIEITGEQGDKNDLLIDFIVKCILPNKYNPEWKSSGAVLVLTEHQINILKIIKVIEAHLKTNNILDSSKGILEMSLKNLTIFNCYSAEDLDITIINLERLILAKDNINLVVFDNIASYYWIAKQDNNTLSYYQHSSNIFPKIFNVIKTLNVLLIFTRSKKMSFVSKKSFQNVDYQIYIEDREDDCKHAEVTDFAGQRSVSVKYKANIIVEFL